MAADAPLLTAFSQGEQSPFVVSGPVPEKSDASDIVFVYSGQGPQWWAMGRELLEQEPVSKLCDELGLQPTLFYRWQKEFFENGAAAFQAKARSDHQAEQDRIAYLEKKMQRKDEVLAELMAEHIALKKELGEL